MYPNISLAIATMNRYDSFLKNNIEKYLNNTYIDEIVISDENGEDAKKIMADFSFQVKEKKIVVSINDERKGPFMNKRKAVSLAKFDWVCLMDSDNYAGVDYFEAWTSYIKNKGIDNHSIYMPSKSKPQKNHQGFNYTHMPEILNKFNYKSYYFQNNNTSFNTCNYIVNKNWFLRKEFDGDKSIIEKDCLDVLYQNFLLLQEPTTKLIHVPGMQYDHSVHPGSYYMNSNNDHPFFDKLYAL